jgi:hypothetical protein
MERSPVGARHLGDLLLHVPTVAPKQVGQVLLGEGLNQASRASARSRFFQGPNADPPMTLLPPHPRMVDEPPPPPRRPRRSLLSSACWPGPPLPLAFDVADKDADWIAGENQGEHVGRGPTSRSPERAGATIPQC